MLENAAPFTTMTYHPIEGTAPLIRAITMLPLVLDPDEASQSESKSQQEPSPEHARIAELEAELAGTQQEMQMRIEGARQQERESAEKQAEASATQSVQTQLEQIRSALSAFDQERDRYFAAVEREVVQLSLAIAARILHREAQMDPLFLTGAVRVALEQVQEGTECILFAPKSDLPRWCEWAAQLGSSTKLQVRSCESAGADPTGVRLQTRAGHIELGAKAQLKEIERGFMDLLQHRPTVAKGEEPR